MARRRRLAARHLARVYGRPLTTREKHRLVDEAFVSYARYWADSLRIPSLDARQIAAGITYEGLEHIDASVAAGKGTILALPHLGGWDWAGTDMARRGHRLSVVVEALQPPDVFEWFVYFRQQLGMNVIPLGPGAGARCREALADNGVLCLLCDRVVGDSAAVEVAFFGEKTLLPAGPATLALRTGATLLPAAVYFGEGASEHRGVVLPPVEVSRGGRLRDDVQVATQALARGLEELVRRAPTQWHLMHPNWPSDADSDDSHWSVA